MNNCSCCGKWCQSKFCSKECENKIKEIIALGKKSFPSYSKAAKYLDKDVRIIKKWEGKLFEIDKSLPPTKTILIECKICGKKDKSKNIRSGYCKECSSKGLGRKEQAKKISQKYKGEGNPNFVDGKASERMTFRQSPEGKAWRRDVIKRDGVCRISGRKDHLTAHHILPASLFPEYKLEVWNGISLNSFYHIELHRFRLDVELLPNLYESLQDAQDLIEELLRQPQVQLLRQLAWKQHPKHELLRVVPRNYHKLIQYLHPEFAQSVLNLPAFQS